MRAPTPARFCFCVCVCACVCAACALGRARLRVCVCVSIVYVLLLLCACVRGLPRRRASAKFLKNTRRFWCLHPSPPFEISSFALSVFAFLFFFFSRARLRWNFRSFGAFPSLVRSHYLKFCSVCLSTECRRWPEWSEHVKYFNNNNKYHALRAGVNNRQVGHRASAKKFLLFTERDILRCVYRSAKRSVYTNFMFAFFWTDKMVPGWLGLIDDQLPIAGVSCDVSITWRTAPVDYFICRSYIILSSNLFYRFTV